MSTAARDFPRDDLIRMVELSDTQVEFRDDAEGRLMTGMPIVFDKWTEIDGWEGHFLERIAPGAITKTLKERGDRVKVLFNHGFDPQIGDKPLGKPRLMEPREKGLWTETPLSKTSYNSDLIELLSDGAIDGMSFRFSVTRESWDENGKVNKANPKGLPMRTIEELRLYEFGPVTFPAYEATTVGVRGREAYTAWRTVKEQPGKIVITTPVNSLTDDVQYAGLIAGNTITGNAGIFVGSSTLSVVEADSDADLTVTSERTDTPPDVAPVEETSEIEPIFTMPVRQLDVAKFREIVAAYAARADKIERTNHG